MTEKIEEKCGIVLILDALGVSKYNMEACREYLNKQNQLKLMINFVKKGIEHATKNGEYHDEEHFINSQVFIFGDTIIICYPFDNLDITSNQFNRILGVSVDASVIMCWGLSEGILFRGCITVGNYLYDENSVMGPAIFDAVEWYEAANWFGVIVSPKSQLWIESVLSKYDKEYGKNEALYPTLVLHEVPLSHFSNPSTEKKLWTVPWPHMFFLKDFPFGSKSLAPRENFLNMLYNIPQTRETEPKFKNSIDYFDIQEKIAISLENRDQKEC